MKNFTLQKKQALEAASRTGVRVRFVSYNPSTTVGNPETAATSAGYVEYYRETTANLVEVVYTSSVVA